MQGLHKHVLQKNGYNITVSIDAARVSKMFQRLLKDFEIETIMEHYNIAKEEAEIMYYLGVRLAEKKFNYKIGETK